MCRVLDEAIDLVSGLVMPLGGASLPGLYFAGAGACVHRAWRPMRPVGLIFELVLIIL
jgi:hypothetical protein